MNKFVKIYIFIILFFNFFAVFLSATPVRAACSVAKNVKSVDPSECWTKETCEAEDGYFQWTDQCPDYACQGGGRNSDGELVGRCYAKFDEAVKLQEPIPLLPSVQEVFNKYPDEIYAIGDVKSETSKITDVKNFGVYLAVLYSYFISVIGVVAVVMMAWGGYQWMMAAGSAEKITQAKNTIQGAIVGLILGVGSYFILNLINQRLVNFDPLQLPMVKPIYLADKCSKLHKKEKGVDPEVKLVSSTPVIVKASEASCGEQYVLVSEQTTSCMGDYCPSNKGKKEVCLPLAKRDPKNPNKTYGCQGAEKACQYIDDDNVNRYAAQWKRKVDKDNTDTWNSVCELFDDKEKEDEINLQKDTGYCRWVEYANFRDDKCMWYTPEEIIDICRGKNKCTDFNPGFISTTGSNLSGDDWAGCRYNFCRDFLKRADFPACIARWNDWTTEWTCDYK